MPKYTSQSTREIFEHFLNNPQQANGDLPHQGSDTAGSANKHYNNCIVQLQNKTDQNIKDKVDAMLSTSADRKPLYDMLLLLREHKTDDGLPLFTKGYRKFQTRLNNEITAAQNSCKAATRKLIEANGGTIDLATFDEKMGTAPQEGIDLGKLHHLLDPENQDAAIPEALLDSYATWLGGLPEEHRAFVESQAARFAAAESGY